MTGDAQRSVEELEAMALSDDVEQRAIAASDARTPKEQLAALIDDEEPAVRRLVLTNPAARNIAPRSMA